jgi:hypothetical protein
MVAADDWLCVEGVDYYPQYQQQQQQQDQHHRPLPPMANFMREVVLLLSSSSVKFFESILFLTKICVVFTRKIFDLKQKRTQTSG